MAKELDPAAPVAATEATAVAPTASSDNTFTASVNLSGSPLKAVVVISAVGIVGFMTAKLVNKHCRERKIEVTEK